MCKSTKDVLLFTQEFEILTKIDFIHVRGVGGIDLFICQNVRKKNFFRTVTSFTYKLRKWIYIIVLLDRVVPGLIV